MVILKVKKLKRLLASKNEYSTWPNCDTQNIEPIPKESIHTNVLPFPPGMEYLLAGPEEAGTGRLLVTMQSVVVPWTPRLGLLISEGLRNGCPWTIWSKNAHSEDFTRQFKSVDNSEKGLKKHWTTCCVIRRHHQRVKLTTLKTMNSQCVSVQHKIKTEIKPGFVKIWG